MVFVPLNDFTQRRPECISLEGRWHYLCNEMTALPFRRQSMDTLEEAKYIGGGLSLRRAVGSLVTVMVLSAALPSWSQAASSAKQDPKPAPSQTDSAQATATVDSRLTKLQEKQLLAELDETFHFVSKDTGLEIKRPIKSKFTSRDEVNKFLRKKFDEDKDTKRMEN